MCWMSPSVSWGVNCSSFALESCAAVTIPPCVNRTRNGTTETTVGNLNARPSFPASFSPDRASRIINSDPGGRNGSDLWWKWGFSIWQLKRCDKRLSHGSGRRSELERISCWLHSQSCFVSGLLEDGLWTSLFWQMNMFHLEEYFSQQVHTLMTCLQKYAFGCDKFNESGWMAEWTQTLFLHKNLCLIH